MGLESDEGGLVGRRIAVSHGSTRVLHDAAISIHPGRVTALIGPNGSGKSTLLRAVARLHPLEAGVVELDGTEASRALSPREFARQVAMLSQSRPTPGGTTVRDIVGHGRHPHRSRLSGRDPNGAAEIDWALSVTGTDGLADRGIDELSGGERQRVWLAMCLAQRTDVLLLDEPTTFLDLRYQVEILDLVAELAEHHDIGIGIVLHDLQQAAEIADEIVLLDAGRVAAHGPVEEVFDAAVLSDVFGCRIEVDHDGDSVTVRARGRSRSRSPRSTTGAEHGESRERVGRSNRGAAERTTRPSHPTPTPELTEAIP